MDQLEGDPPIGLTEVALSLARRPILTHRDRQVRLYAAQAIADVLRIYAPDAPYELEDLQVHTHTHTHIISSSLCMFVGHNALWRPPVTTCIPFIPLPTTYIYTYILYYIIFGLVTVSEVLVKRTPVHSLCKHI